MKQLEYRVKREHSIHDLIGVCDGIPIYLVGGKLYYGKDWVSSDFPSFICTPFSRVSHIRFTFKRYLNPNAKGLRRSFVCDLLKQLNGLIKRNHPDIISGYRTVRCIFKTEYGSFDDEDEAHLHILWLVDDRVRDLVERTVSLFFFYLEMTHPNPIQSIVTQKIRDIGKQISYVCKVRGTRDPEYQYINGIKKIITKKYRDNPKGLTTSPPKHSKACHSFPYSPRTSAYLEISRAFPRLKTFPLLDYSCPKTHGTSFMSPSINWDITPTASRSMLMV
jgi:hypothetical protein